MTDVSINKQEKESETTRTSGSKQPMEQREERSVCVEARRLCFP